jgi:hypothetical protein
MTNETINRFSIAYTEGWNSSTNAHTGGNPHQNRAGQNDWLAGRSEALKHFGIQTWDDFITEHRASQGAAA